MQYQVKPIDDWDIVSSKFGSFLVEKSDKTLVPFQTVTLDLLCGCVESVEVVTYSVKPGDTLFTICSRLNASQGETAKLNQLDNPSLIHAGDVIFIPKPGGIEKLIVADTKDPKDKRQSKSRTYLIIALILGSSAVAFLIYYCKKKTRKSQPSPGKQESLPFYFPSISSKTSKTTFTVSDESVARSISVDKTTIFPYNEVCEATSNFSMSLKIGQGSYGSVFLGKLRGINMAIKQMKSSKSKEFLAELNILCRVHHTNLIELIGYAAGGESLFLIYEFAKNGALSEHIHNPRQKGHKPLPWTTRVQIALDAAKGLEYIHVHTRPYYVHRDVKTSNILLDHNFRAKIADFGLVKLLEHSPVGEGAAASRIVGTFGYLAPEYVRDGCVTTKSDVYAYGVVLLELLTGMPALTRDTNSGNNQSEHRSLVEYVLPMLENAEDSLSQLTCCIDPNLTRYHPESALQIGLLAKACVDEDWNRRPDMSNVVLRLSHIHMFTMDWETNTTDTILFF